MKYFDSHCHLNDSAFDGDAKEAFLRAKEAGVLPIIIIGWDLESSKKAIAMAEAFGEGVYAAIGYHPENLEGITEEGLKEIEKLALSSPKVVAIGEIGLDHHWFKDPKDHENQRVWFIRQIELANHVGLPISIHARDAMGDMLQILKEHPVDKGGVLHCYSGSVETMKELLKLGFYFGFDGPITYKNAKEPKACVAECPMDRLLVETDCPYLSPVPLRGTRNEPQNIPHIVKAVAELKETSEEAVAAALKENLFRLFHVKHD